MSGSLGEGVGKQDFACALASLSVSKRDYRVVWFYLDLIDECQVLDGRGCRAPSRWHRRRYQCTRMRADAPEIRAHVVWLNKEIDDTLAPATTVTIAVCRVQRPVSSLHCRSAVFTASSLTCSIGGIFSVKDKDSSLRMLWSFLVGVPLLFIQWVDIPLEPTICQAQCAQVSVKCSRTCMLKCCPWLLSHHSDRVGELQQKQKITEVCRLLFQHLSKKLQCR